MIGCAHRTHEQVPELFNAKSNDKVQVEVKFRKAVFKIFQNLAILIYSEKYATSISIKEFGAIN